MNSISAKVSVVYWFKATTIFLVNLQIFSKWTSRLDNPLRIPSNDSFWIFSLEIPPWYFKALVVTTKTTASGFNLALRHLISKNFSAPKSEPKPASVIT